MRTPILALALCAAPLTLSFDEPALEAPHGKYVEVRNVTVFAGPCHYNGEYDTRGREAILAWQFDGGSFGRESFADRDLVVTLSDSVNLAEGPTKDRRAVIWVRTAPMPWFRDAAVSWLRQELGAELGEEPEVREVDTIDVTVKEGSFRIDAEGKSGRVHAKGDGLPDRECCTMSYNVWYSPFAQLAKPLVGHVERAVISGSSVVRKWGITEENAAFYGSFPRRAAVED